MLLARRLLRVAPSTALATAALAFIASACSSDPWNEPADRAQSQLAETVDEAATPPSPSNAAPLAEEDELSPAEDEGSRAEDDILVALQKVRGIVEVREAPSRYPGTRFFILGFEQPADHFAPQGGKFTQRAALLFRAREAPMVLATTGYGITTSRATRSEPAFLLQANQLLVEHRYFTPSIPSPSTVDWSKLDIFQMATDEHRIVRAFKPLFPKKWLSTGGSKGGMTAIYHRFFYPDDVFATVPYVAPSSFGRSDPRYITFLERVGDPDCRAKLKTFQVEVLRRRGEIESRMAAEAAAAGDGYELAGGIHLALDYAVTEAPFTFWQYGERSFCADIPRSTATTDELYAYLRVIYGSMVGAIGDRSLTYFAPYYYQASTELGGPGYTYSHIRSLLTPNFRDLPQALPPLGVAKRFRPTSMPLVTSWVHFSMTRMLFIYGENDPWSSGAFQVRRENDSFRYFVPDGNHGSNISALPAPQRTEALAHLARWMDVPIPPATAAPARDGAAEPPFESLALWRRLHPTGD
ncbi:S28 family serine protease [Pendulispora albinea]|uniref:Uncharacterized protein n=1 Tax=Pendulispora albinea TaxID=2741071 RepID=A0ABZ2M9E9_9BACT